jgi:hypothetical protein
MSKLSFIQHFGECLLPTLGTDVMIGMSQVTLIPHYEGRNSPQNADANSFLPWLIAQEDLIAFSHCESFKSYIILYYTAKTKNLPAI